MPEICRFKGIVIKMYSEDHAHPHFHAEFAEWKATFLISSLELDEGGLPVVAVRLVKRWAKLHHTELRDNWTLVEAGKPPTKIQPLE